MDASHVKPRRFRTRPAEVVAEQFTPGDPGQMERLGIVNMGAWTGGDLFAVGTAEGRWEIKPGHWVYTDADGERHSLPPEAFEAEFEPVE